MKTGTLESYRPKMYSFRLRFKTYNPTCYDCEAYYDEVNIKIENSGELKGQLCDYSSITVENPMNVNKQYEVSDLKQLSDETQKKFLVTSKLLGVDTLD